MRPKFHQQWPLPLVQFTAAMETLGSEEDGVTSLIFAFQLPFSLVVKTQKKTCQGGIYPRHKHAAKQGHLYLPYKV